MKYCTKCCMPSTRPGITFDERGVCSACRSYEHRAIVDLPVPDRPVKIKIIVTSLISFLS